MSRSLRVALPPKLRPALEQAQPSNPSGRDPTATLTVNQWASDHAHTLAGGRPILALDMYEHSYHLDYGAKAAGYVDAFMQVVDWAAADRRYAAVGRP